MMKIFLIPVAAIALSSCVTTGDDKTDGTNVRIGQTAYVDGPRIRPVAVLEDSRCPANAQCVWAGRVRLKMLWIRPAGDQEFELVSGEATPLADGSIILISVSPEKTIDKPLISSDYRFSFQFRGGI